MHDKDHVSCLWSFLFSFVEMRFYLFLFFFYSIRFRLARTRTEILFDTNARKIREIFIPIIRFILHVFVIDCNLTFT